MTRWEHMFASSPAETAPGVGPPPGPPTDATRLAVARRRIASPPTRARTVVPHLQGERSMRGSALGRAAVVAACAAGLLVPGTAAAAKRSPKVTRGSTY